MNPFNLRDFLFKDRPGEEFGQRAEVIITLSLGFLATALAYFTYSNPIIVAASIITNAVALFTLIQAIRGRYKYLIVFPALTAVSICLVSILEGEGVHDMIWIGTLGMFLLAHVYSRSSNFPAILLGIFMTVLFASTGAAEVISLLPNPYATSAEYVVLNTFFLVVIMVAMTAVFHRHRALLRAAVTNRNDQVTTNQLLEETNRTLEDQVQARTNDLNKANNQMQIKTMRLQAASEISQEIMANIHETPAELLTRATRSISEKLGFYHVGIFLLDENREYAALRAANSKGGQQMLARRHQLRVGGTGIVGYVAQSGRPRIALDTGADAVFFNNPDLPDTRSEIALPLKYGTSIIGVLDVQSAKSSAFNTEDANTLSTLANQIAIVIKNLRAFESDGISTQFKIVSRQAGVQPNREQAAGYTFTPDGSISNSQPENSPTFDKAVASGETVVLHPVPKGSFPTLAVPVKLRDQVIGVIHIEASESNRKWTEDEVAMIQAISERAALALENARLLENATQRAEQEETIAHITTQIGSSTDFNRILQTTIQELGLALGTSRSFIQLATPAENSNVTPIE